MHDIVIRGGTIVDGTGKARFSGDVAIDGDRIVQVGGKAGPGRREIDAVGQLVTPGWVDVHTHYDGQATWDPVLAPSSWHGVTTILMGNCGVGFAPVRKRDHDCLIDLMEGVEDIPGIALAEGLRWDWETFPEYLDALDRTERTIDVAAQIPHHPLRVYVMGERAIRREAATSDDIEQMHRFTAEALRAGAFGFTTSRTDQHKTTSGDLVPGRYAEERELSGIGRALGDVGAGAFGMLSDFDDEQGEFAWITEMTRQMGRPFWFLLTDRSYDPQRWRRLMDGVRQARAAGANVVAQVAGRPVGVILGLTTSLTPFAARPSFAALSKLPVTERLERLRDPALRAKILAETPSEELLAIMPPLQRPIATRWDRQYVLGDPPDYEPDESRSIAAMAAKTNLTPEEFCYDYLIGGNGDRMLFYPVTNYVFGDHGVVHEMITDKDTVLGLSDGGAHCGLICDSSLPSYMLTHWVRDRQRGPRIGLEFAVKRLTSETADFFGFRDRGRLAPGMKADVNVVDLDALRLHHPEMRYDLPAGGKRLVQRVDGYTATIVSGVPIFERGEETGARPGKLVRA
ncbi:MAG: amidohydrolase family protein [Rhodospirillales bacterium]|nr:amidohydrolase family protein [Rhodospirillales bacterium]